MKFMMSSAIAAFLMLAVTPASAQFSGGIFTSTSTGTTVNANIYDLRTDVFLNGGPQNVNTPGLPNGTYYFQVTDPSGATLLSTDNAICRQLVVSNGRVAGSTGPCPHQNGALNLLNGSRPVQLAPINFTPNPGGEYKVWLIAQSSAVASCTPTVSEQDPLVILFTNNCSKTDNFKVREQPRPEEPQYISITGYKWYDANTDCVKDPSELIIPGWRIEKRPPNTADITYTAGNGLYGFLVLANSGVYVISEVLPGGGATWVNTCPLSGQVNAQQVDVAGPNFGNVCLGPGGGLTLGFWSNKNGQALIAGDDLQMLRWLNLRNADGTDFDPNDYNTFRTWILSATATNMSYMLSAQLAAMALNVYNNKVSTSALLYAPGVTGANSAGFINVVTLINEASSQLGLDGNAISGDSNRAYQELIKNALDQGNNNLNFVQAQACPFTTPY